MDEYLEHHGIKGMKWGVRKQADPLSNTYFGNRAYAKQQDEISKSNYKTAKASYKVAKKAYRDASTRPTTGRKYLKNKQSFNKSKRQFNNARGIRRAYTIQTANMKIHGYSKAARGQQQRQSGITADHPYVKDGNMYRRNATKQMIKRAGMKYYVAPAVRNVVTKAIIPAVVSAGRAYVANRTAATKMADLR